jgi:hypothetical protein
MDDFWVLKLDASGNVQWQKTYGGVDDDRARSIQQTSDGGYVAAGWTKSFGAGNSDYWVLKLDASGNVQWQKTYGGADWDYTSSIQQTADGGFVVEGYSVSFGAGNWDFWVLNLDASGNVQWQKTYGGAGDDRTSSIQQTTDGGYVVAGNTVSFGAGSNDFWVLKLDASGNVTWQKTYGSNDRDRAYSIQQTADGGFVVAGRTTSFGAGGEDSWVLKLDANGEIDASCTFIADTAATITDTTATITFTTVSGVDSAATVTNTSVTGADSAAAIDEQCPGACPALDPAVVSNISPDPACDGDTITFTAQAATGGVPSYTYRWDFTDDGVFDATAQTAANVYAAGGYTVRLRVEDSCGAGAQFQETTAPVTVNSPAPAITESACDVPTPGKVTLNANPTSGTPPYMFLWSTGAKSQAIAVAGDGATYSVLVMDADGCLGTDSRVTTLCPLCVEPSAVDVSPAVPPLAVTTTGAVVVEELGCASGYVVYENALGTWYGTPGRVCVSPVSPNGDGTVTLTGYTVPVDSWIVVSSANAVGESSCGRDSAGVEHNTMPGWPATGPCP